MNNPLKEFRPESLCLLKETQEDYWCYARKGPQDFSVYTEKSSIYEAPMKEKFRESSDVLVRWTDGLLYLATIIQVEDEYNRCAVKFEDGSQFWALYKDIYKGPLPDNEFACTVCDSASSQPPDEIVICDKCSVGYHQLCHIPKISTADLNPEIPWSCRKCVFVHAAKKGGASKKGPNDSKSVNSSPVSMLKCRTLFEIIPPFANLALQVWLALVLMNILVIRDCLSNFLWLGLKLEILVNSIIKILCASYSLLWASFLNKAQMNFSEPIYWKRAYNKLENGEDSSSLDKTPPRIQVQRNELSVESKKCGQFMSQDCHSVNERLCFKNLIRSSRFDSPVIELIKRNVGTQTLNEQDVLNNDCLDLQSPTNTSILSIFGEGELISAEACSNCLNNSDIGKPVTMKCKFTPVRHSSVSPKLKNGTSSRSLSSEFEKSASSSENQNVSRTTSENVPEEFVDIPLESPRNISQLLESPLCQINLDSMKNLRLTFSEDICIPTLSPKEKSIFRKSWNKLKLVRKVNKGFLEMKNLKRRNPDGISIISRQPLAGVKCTAAPSQKDTKNLTADVEDSEIIGCCSLFHKLKSKFDQKGDEGSVFYKKF